MGQDLAVGERAVDGGAHGPQVLLADVGVDRRAGQLAVGEPDPVLAGGDDHLLQIFGADLMAQPARAAVNADDHVARLEAIALRDARIVNFGDVLDFKVVVAAAECAHLVALAFLGMFRDMAGLGVLHLPAFFDAVEIGLAAPAALHGPFRAAGEHGIHLGGVQADGAG